MSDVSSHEVPAALALALSASFGSVAQWHAQVAAMLQAADSGRVWLCFQASAGRLSLRWVRDPEQGAGDAAPLLALDAGEPLGGIDWAQVHARYQDAVAKASEGLGVTPDDAVHARLLDVRRAAAYASSDATAEGAEWRDPAHVRDWSAQLPRHEPVVVYCVHGHEVSRAAALWLRAEGIDARFLIGGLEGWRAAGRPLAAKPVH